MGDFNPKRENAGNVRNQSAQVAGSRAEARFDLKEVWDADEVYPQRERTLEARAPGQEREREKHAPSRDIDTYALESRER